MLNAISHFFAFISRKRLFKKIFRHRSDFFLFHVRAFQFILQYDSSWNCDRSVIIIHEMFSNDALGSLVRKCGKCYHGQRKIHKSSIKFIHIDIAILLTLIEILNLLTHKIIPRYLLDTQWQHLLVQMKTYRVQTHRFISTFRHRLTICEWKSITIG